MSARYFLALALASVLASLYPNCVHAQSNSITIDSTSVSGSTLKVSGSYTLASGWTQAATGITVWAIEDGGYATSAVILKGSCRYLWPADQGASVRGGLAAAGAWLSCNEEQPCEGAVDGLRVIELRHVALCGGSFSTSIIVPKGTYTIYASIDVTSGCTTQTIGGVSTSQTVSCADPPVVCGTVTIDQTKTTGKVKSYDICATWTANAGYARDDPIQYQAFGTVKGQQSFFLTIPKVASGATVSSVQGLDIPKGDYMVYVIVPFKDKNGKIQEESSTPGFKITVTDK
jgi:hypothetical protein